MRFTDTPELASWRGVVRAFVAENWKPGGPHDELAMHGPNAAAYEEITDKTQNWLDKLAANSWIAPAWPKKYGGADMSVLEQFVLNVLAYAWASVQEHGWSASSSKHPTRYQVEDLLTGRAKRPEFDAIQPRMAEAEHLAPTIHRALLEAFADATEGYQANLRAVLSGEAVTSRHLGLAVSAIPAYDRLMGQQAVSATREERPASAWLGSIGEKVTITGVVITALTVDGYAYNTTQMLVVIDAAPTIAKVYTSAAWADEISVGDQVTITGTVKAHETWRDEIHQTVLTRTKRLIPAVDQECSTAARG